VDYIPFGLHIHIFTTADVFFLHVVWLFIEVWLFGLVVEEGLVVAAEVVVSFQTQIYGYSPDLLDASIIVTTVVRHDEREEKKKGGGREILSGCDQRNRREKELNAEQRTAHNNFLEVAKISIPAH
jgi:hypothetical protein